MQDVAIPTALETMTRAEVETYIAQREQTLISELNSIDDQPMTQVNRVARKREIRDERAALWRVRALWRKLHRPANAGPDQRIG